MNEQHPDSETKPIEDTPPESSSSSESIDIQIEDTPPESSSSSESIDTQSVIDSQETDVGIQQPEPKDTKNDTTYQPVAAETDQTLECVQDSEKAEEQESDIPDADASDEDKNETINSTDEQDITGTEAQELVKPTNNQQASADNQLTPQENGQTITNDSQPGRQANENAFEQELSQQLDKDRKEFDKYQQDFNQERDWIKRFWNSFTSAKENYENILNNEVKTDQLLELLEQDSEIAEKLRQRWQSLELTVKMLDRCHKELKAFQNNPPDFPSFPNEVEQLPPSDEQRSIEKLTFPHYQAVCEARYAVEQIKKTNLTLIVSKVLPVLDGLDSGKKYAHQLQNFLDDHFKQRLQTWLNYYDDLKNILLMNCLSEFDIKEIPENPEDAIGQPVDYQKHEPVDVEPDSAMEDETIKEVVRSGYLIKDKVLRPIQVIVVKNVKEETSDAN